MKVRFCENNKGKSQVFRRLQEEFPDIDAKIKKCLGQCGSCAEQPIAMVGGKKVKGKDVEGLYRNIVAALREGVGTEQKKDKKKKNEKNNR
ncbi:hypothetical protein AOG1_18770 [Geobacter sp. AOG1]|nr:hypothetical protein AOG1_18770 [Geobacter sp. AOG1]